MQGDPIVFDRVWKKFRRGERHDSLRDLIPALAKRAIRRRTETELDTKEFWALQDISFSVRRGEALGIIGPNGAGKSTTLKLLTRILKPTRGSCRVLGRVGTLIEVAAGFHPDLTGRENIYLQGAVMGMKRAEIDRRLDEIIEFAGVAAFVDTQVKRYSSGMNARLGFSIAAHLDPDVLIIDEVLSVGDMAFQARCVERMTSFKKQGVTIVFVSHNLQAVAGLCERSLYLQSTARSYGPTADVVGEYVKQSRRATSPSDGEEVSIIAAELTTERGEPVTVVKPGERLRLRATFEANTVFSEMHFGFIVWRSTDDFRVFHAHIEAEEVGITKLTPGQRVTLDFHFRTHLTRGQYHVDCNVFHNPTFRYVTRLCPAGIFRVEESRTFTGVADLDLRWDVIDAASPAREVAIEPDSRVIPMSATAR